MAKNQRSTVRTTRTGGQFQRPTGASKPNRKAAKRLNARLKDYEAMLASSKGTDYSGYHRPGSMK